MGQKLRTILSELATDVKSTNVDDYISFRYIHSKFISKLDYFLRLEAKNRDIFKDLTLWKPIHCVELEDVNVNTCGYVDYCNTLKKSKIQIPDAFNTNYGQLIKILTIDGFTEFNMIKSDDYKDYINREFLPKKEVYWLENKYIYIPNTDIEIIKILIIPKNLSEVDKINNNNSCNLILDSEINYPDYLITLAKQETLKEISSVYKRVVEDEKGDNNSNIKN